MVFRSGSALPPTESATQIALWPPASPMNANRRPLGDHAATPATVAHGDAMVVVLAVVVVALVTPQPAARVTAAQTTTTRAMVIEGHPSPTRETRTDLKLPVPLRRISLGDESSTQTRFDPC